MSDQAPVGREKSPTQNDIGSVVVQEAREQADGWCPPGHVIMEKGKNPVVSTVNFRREHQ